MTETDWNTSEDPALLLGWLESQGRLQTLGVRRWLCACCRQVEEQLHPVVRRMVVAAEKLLAEKTGRRGPGPSPAVVLHECLLALHQTRLEELDDEVCHLTLTMGTEQEMSSKTAVLVRSLCPPATPAGQAELVREIFPRPGWDDRPPTWAAWQDGPIAQIVEVLQKSQAFDQLPVLADALEEAGCHHAALLSHLRRPTGHQRDCWALAWLADQVGSRAQRMKSASQLKAIP
ncbi:MAG: hypothetical protein U0840_23735 [Gemmataceae bacterium]